MKHSWGEMKKLCLIISTILFATKTINMFQKLEIVLKNSLQGDLCAAGPSLGWIVCK